MNYSFLDNRYSKLSAGFRSRMKRKYYLVILNVEKSKVNNKNHLFFVGLALTERKIPLKIRKSKWYEFSLDIFMSGSKKHVLICCSWDHCDIKHHLLMRTMRKTESKLVSAHINAVLRTALKKKEELQQQEKKKWYYYLLYSLLSLY